MSKLSWILVLLSWIAVLLASIASVSILSSGLNAAVSAPQDASVTALAIAVVVIPYCFARAVSEIFR